MKLETLDIGVFIAYVLGLLILALWISRGEKNHERNTEDYFLASKALPWWAIGASYRFQYFGRTNYWYVRLWLCHGVSDCLI